MFLYEKIFIHYRESVTRIVFKLKLWGDGLGPTDVPEPFFEFLYSPFVLLQYFKDGGQRSKIDNILVSDPDSRGYFRSDWPANFCLSKCMSRIPCLRLFPIWKQAMHPCLSNLEIQQQSAE